MFYEYDLQGHLWERISSMTSDFFRDIQKLIHELDNFVMS